MAPRKAQSTATRTKLAKRLKALRERMGLSQRQLAKEWHVVDHSGVEPMTFSLQRPKKLRN